MRDKSCLSNNNKTTGTTIVVNITNLTNCCLQQINKYRITNPFSNRLKLNSSLCNINSSRNGSNHRSNPR